MSTKERPERDGIHPFLRKDGASYREHLEALLEERTAGLRRANERLDLEIINRKLVEEALNESRKRFDMFMRNLPGAAFIKDTQGNYIYVNETWERIFGKKMDEAYGMSSESVWPPETAAHLREIEESVLRNGKPAQVTDITEHPEGPRYWLAVKFPIFNEDGAAIMLGGVAIDITERKRIEHALSQSEEHYQSLFEYAPISLWEADFSRVKARLEGLRKNGVSDFRAYFGDHPEDLRACQTMMKVVDVNRETLRLYGAADKAELIMNLGRLFTESSHALFGETLVGIAEGRISAEGESSDITLKGETINTLKKWFVAPGHEDTLSKVLICVTDITIRKRADEALRNYQKHLRSLSSQLTLVGEQERRKIAAVVHDNIGQILAYCKIKLGVLCQSAPDGLKSDLEQTRAYVEQAIQSARSLTFELSPPILYEVGFEAAVEWLGEQYEKQHGITFRFSDDKRQKSLTHETRVLLYQSVREVFTNIVKHSRARNVHVSVARENGGARIAIKDDGIGFDTARVFARTEGFGFFSIRERLSHIGGSLRVNSEPAGGTRVVLFAPLRSEGTGGPTDPAAGRPLKER